jgi:hypothetical protein
VGPTIANPRTTKKMIVLRKRNNDNHAETMRAPTTIPCLESCELLVMAHFL